MDGVGGVEGGREGGREVEGGREGGREGGGGSEGGREVTRRATFRFRRTPKGTRTGTQKKPEQFRNTSLV
jgi:hypothetical protein